MMAKKPSIRLLQEELFPVKEKCQDIGIQLDLDDESLDRIERTHAMDHSTQLRQILRLWLEREDACWETLIKALRAPTIDESVLASELEAKYCGNIQQVPVTGASRSTIQQDPPVTVGSTVQQVSPVTERQTPTISLALKDLKSYYPDDGLPQSPASNFPQSEHPIGEPVSFGIEEFVRIPPADRLCCQCTRVPRKPRHLECCGKLFCQPCAEVYLSEMPVCTKHQVRLFFKTPTNLSRIISDTTVRCIKCKNWKGLARHLGNHLRTCPENTGTQVHSSSVDTLATAGTSHFNLPGTMVTTLNTIPQVELVSSPLGIDDKETTAESNLKEMPIPFDNTRKRSRRHLAEQENANAPDSMIHTPSKVPRLSEHTEVNRRGEPSSVVVKSESTAVSEKPSTVEQSTVDITNERLTAKVNKTNNTPSEVVRSGNPGNSEQFGSAVNQTGAGQSTVSYLSDFEMPTAYDCVDPLKSDHKCTVCYCVPTKAKKSVCCGKVYCEPCASKAKQCTMHRKKLLFVKNAELDAELDKLMVRCKNHDKGCVWKKPANHLKEHLLSSCEIPCPYSAFGCTSSVTNKNIRSHMAVSALDHLDMLRRSIEGLRELRSQLQSDITTQYIPQRVFMISHVSEHSSAESGWTSPSFYVRQLGCKVHLVMWFSSTGSVMNTNVVHDEGANDDILEWPCRGTIVVEIVNQTMDEKHAKHAMNFVLDKEVGCFSSHCQLVPERKSLYVVQDRLYIRVVRVSIDSQIPWL